jgi:hypothetical protein
MSFIEAWFEVGLLLQCLIPYTNFSYFSAPPAFPNYPPALGEIELMDGVGGHLPEDRLWPLPAWPKRAAVLEHSLENRETVECISQFAMLLRVCNRQSP